jgi:hypothetical protein
MSFSARRTPLVKFLILLFALLVVANAPAGLCVSEQGVQAGLIGLAAAAAIIWPVTSLRLYNTFRRWGSATYSSPSAFRLVPIAVLGLSLSYEVYLFSVAS